MIRIAMLVVVLALAGCSNHQERHAPAVARAAKAIKAIPPCDEALPLPDSNLYRYRDKATGRFVSELQARCQPETTVRESR